MTKLEAWIRCVLSVALCACTGAVTEAPSGADDDAAEDDAVDDVGGSGGTGAGGSAGQGGTGFPKPRPDAHPFADDGGKLRDGAGIMPLRRLGRTEYANVVRDLVGSSPSLEALPADAADDSGYLSGPAVSPVEAAAFLELAERVAEDATKNLRAISPCQPTQASQEESCANQFVTTFGERAFRRPLTEAERSELIALYRRGRTDARLDWSSAIGLVIQGMLMSPRFLYHWELGEGPAVAAGGAIALSEYEIASRLSFLLTESMPDDELFAAAKRKELSTATAREREARRLLATPRARSAVVSFLEQWLGLTRLDVVGKDSKRYPTFDDALLRDMQQESRRFVADVVFDQDGRWNTLLTASFSYVNQSLARVRGVGGVTGADLVRRDLDPSRTSGILTQPALLTVHASAQEGSPIKRGRLVRERFLCQVPPPVPNDVPPLPPSQPNLPTREHFEQHSINPACSGCHRLMDPIGFGFLHYDAIGAFQTNDGGKPVDARGTVYDMDGQEAVTFDGVKELAALLVESREVKSCITRQAFRFGLGRPETIEEGASLADALAAFDEEGFIKELIVAVARSNTFAKRTPSEGEVLR